MANEAKKLADLRRALMDARVRLKELCGTPIDDAGMVVMPGDEFNDLLRSFSEVLRQVQARLSGQQKREEPQTGGPMQEPVTAYELLKPGTGDILPVAEEPSISRFERQTLDLRRDDDLGIHIEEAVDWEPRVPEVRAMEPTPTPTSFLELPDDAILEVADLPRLVGLEPCVAEQTDRTERRRADRRQSDRRQPHCIIRDCFAPVAAPSPYCWFHVGQHINVPAVKLRVEGSLDATDEAIEGWLTDGEKR